MVTIIVLWLPGPCLGAGCRYGRHYRRPSAMTCHLSVSPSTYQCIYSKPLMLAWAAKRFSFKIPHLIGSKLGLLWCPFCVAWTFQISSNLSRHFYCHTIIIGFTRMHLLLYLRKCTFNFFIFLSGSSVTRSYSESYLKTTVKVRIFDNGNVFEVSFLLQLQAAHALFQFF